MTMPIETVADTVIDPAATKKAATTTFNTSDVCVGRRLRMGRASAGVSQAELCRALAIASDDLRAFEKGTKRIGADLLLRIAKRLKVRPDYFFQSYSAKELGACLKWPRPRAPLLATL